MEGCVGGLRHWIFASVVGVQQFALSKLLWHELRLLIVNLDVAQNLISKHILIIRL